MSLTLLLLLFTFLTGVCPQRLTEIHIKAGELVALRCKGNKHGDAKLVWTSYTTQEMNLTSNLSAAEQNQMGVLVYGRSLVIFNSSVDHQGNYSCTWRNVGKQSWFRLTVFTSQTEEYEESNTYSKTCHEDEACTLNCPDTNSPPANTPNITINGITWYKDGDKTAGNFPRVRKSDNGFYTCTRSYLYHGRVYNKTFTIALEVQPKKESEKCPEITSPRMDDVFYVDLGLPKVIDCEAVVYSDFDEVFWLSGTSFVENNNSFSVFYNYTSEYDSEGIKMKASLVFKNVSKEDLGKKYTCKLESTSDPSSFVTITMALKDEKGHDASHTESNTDAGPHKDVLEENFYDSLFINYLNTLSGKDVSQAILDFVKQSRMVVPVDPWPGFDPVDDIHAVLVEQLVLRKGTNSILPSSSFWKKLQYFLTAPSHASKTRRTATNI